MKSFIFFLLMFFLTSFLFGQHNIGSNNSIMVNCDTIKSLANTYEIECEIGNGVYVCKIYYDSQFQNLKAHYTKVNNKVNGMKYGYFQNGNISSIENYILNIPVGAQITYYETGQIASYFDYGFDTTDLELREKKFRYHTIDTNPPFIEIGWEISYFKPLDGRKYYFFQNGNIMKIESYMNNEACGEWLYYDMNGLLIKKETYPISCKH